jgi:hypothetical protein
MEDEEFLDVMSDTKDTKKSLLDLIVTLKLN